MAISGCLTELSKREDLELALLASGWRFSWLAAHRANPAARIGSRIRLEVQSDLKANDAKGNIRCRIKYEELDLSALRDLVSNDRPRMTIVLQNKRHLVSRYDRPRVPPCIRTRPRLSGIKVRADPLEQRFRVYKTVTMSRRIDGKSNMVGPRVLKLVRGRAKSASREGMPR